MTPNLSVQIHRALSALPLLAIGLAVAAGAVPPADVAAVPVAVPAPVAQVVVVASQGTSSTLPGDAIVALDDLAARSDCAVASRPAGALGLARMPGDIGPLAGRLRCAQ